MIDVSLITVKLVAGVLPKLTAVEPASAAPLEEDLPLNEDQRETRRNDNAYLLRINDDKLRFELPDTAAGDGEMQTGTGIDTVTRTEREHYTRRGMEGLL